MSSWRGATPSSFTRTAWRRIGISRWSRPIPTSGTPTAAAWRGRRTSAGWRGPSRRYGRLVGATAPNAARDRQGRPLRAGVPDRDPQQPDRNYIRGRRRRTGPHRSADARRRERTPEHRTAHQRGDQKVGGAGRPFADHPPPLQEELLCPGLAGDGQRDGDHGAPRVAPEDTSHHPQRRHCHVAAAPDVKPRTPGVCTHAQTVAWERIVGCSIWFYDGTVACFPNVAEETTCLTVLRNPEHRGIALMALYITAPRSQEDMEDFRDGLAVMLEETEAARSQGCPRPVLGSSSSQRPQMIPSLRVRSSHHTTALPRPQEATNWRPQTAASRLGAAAGMARTAASGRRAPLQYEASPRWRPIGAPRLLRSSSSMAGGTTRAHGETLHSPSARRHAAGGRSTPMTYAPIAGTPRWCGISAAPRRTGTPSCGTRRAAGWNHRSPCPTAGGAAAKDSRRSRVSLRKDAPDGNDYRGIIPLRRAAPVASRLIQQSIVREREPIRLDGRRPDFRSVLDGAEACAEVLTRASFPWT